MTEVTNPTRKWISTALFFLASSGFTAIGLACFIIVAGMIYRGDAWAFIIYVEQPLTCLFLGLGSILTGHILLRWKKNTRKDWLMLTGKTILASFSICLALLVGEVGLRSIYKARASEGSLEKLKDYRKTGKKPPVKSTHPLAMIIQPSDVKQVVYELQPGLDVEFGNRRVRISGQGIREDIEYPVERSPETVRILGIGDSGMFGWDVEQGEEYMGVLEKNLNARRDGKSYEVINMAVPGYNTQLEVETLRHKGLQFKPDIVIVGWCENDFSLPLFLLENDNYTRWNKSFLYDLLFKRARQGTEVAPGVTMRDLRNYNKSQVAPELSNGTDVEGVRKALKDLQAMAADHGFKVVLFGPLHKHIRTICNEINFPMANTLEMIPEDTYPKDYLVYYMHPSKEGHAVLAEHIAQNLEERGWLLKKP